MYGATLEIGVTPSLPPKKLGPSKPHQEFENKPFFCDNKSHPNRLCQKHQFERMRFASFRRVWWHI